MKLPIKNLTTWVGAIAIAVLSPLANASIVINGNFEAGFDDWTETGLTALSNPSGGSGRGASVAAAFGGEVGLTGLSQSLATPSALGYTVEFFVKNDSDTGLFSWSLDSIAQPLTPGAIDGDGFTVYTGAILPGSDPTLLAFDFQFFFDDGLIFLDDVSVTERSINNQVPEPGTLLLVGAALTVGAVVRRRKQV